MIFSFSTPPRVFFNTAKEMCQKKRHTPQLLITTS